MEYLRTYQAGLQAAHDTGNLPGRDLLDQVGETIDRFEAVSNESTVLKRQRTILEQDLADEAGGTKRQRGNDDENDEPDVTFLERAYTNTIVPRLMNASRKQRKSRFDQSAFKEDVIKFYRAKREDDLVFCHLTGWKPAELVKAASSCPQVFVPGRGFVSLWRKRNCAFGCPKWYSSQALVLLNFMEVLIMVIRRNNTPQKD